MLVLLTWLLVDRTEFYPPTRGLRTKSRLHSLQVSSSWHKAPTLLTSKNLSYCATWEVRVGWRGRPHPVNQSGGGQVLLPSPRSSPTCHGQRGTSWLWRAVRESPPGRLRSSRSYSSQSPAPTERDFMTFLGGSGLTQPFLVPRGLLPAPPPNPGGPLQLWAWPTMEPGRTHACMHRTPAAGT